VRREDTEHRESSTDMVKLPKLTQSHIPSIRPLSIRNLIGRTTRILWMWREDTDRRDLQMSDSTLTSMREHGLATAYLSLMMHSQRMKCTGLRGNAAIALQSASNPVSYNDATNAHIPSVIPALSTLDNGY
jgi:hypothetical protein